MRNMILGLGVAFAGAMFAAGQAADAAVLVVYGSTLHANTASDVTANGRGPITYKTAGDLFVGNIAGTVGNNGSTGAQTVKQYVEGFDLIVFMSNGGTYDQAGWAGVTKPILSTSPFQTRADRMNWYSGGASDGLGAAAGDETTVLNNHAILAGLTNPNDLFNNGGSLQWPALESPALGTGTLVAKSTDAQATPAVHATIMLWDAGQTQNHGNAVGARRAFFGVTQNDANPVQYLTADGRLAFQQTMDWLTVPEPGTFSVSAGAVALLALRRRRQA